MHAYLIIAHNQFELLRRLIGAIDDERNDIYVHIDKCAKDVDLKCIADAAKKSKIRFIERRKVSWGGYSQIDIEMRLIKIAAENTDYEYLHLLSGVDMPIKGQDEIHDFFDKNQGAEFVHFGSAEISPKQEERIRYYHFFSGRRNYFNRLATKGETVLQRIFGIDRLKGQKMQRGSNWFSITGDLARYVLSCEEYIKKQFRYTYCADEFFIQTIVINSHFKDKLYRKTFDDSCEQNVRYIDWKRGSPYTFCEKDYDEVMSSGCIFARKLTQKNRLSEMIADAIGRKE